MYRCGKREGAGVWGGRGQAGGGGRPLSSTQGVSSSRTAGLGVGGRGGGRGGAYAELSWDPLRVERGALTWFRRRRGRQTGVAGRGGRVESNGVMVEECPLQLDVTQDRKRNRSHSGVSRITSSVSW